MYLHGRKGELDRIIREWRNYTVVLTVVLSILVLVVLYGFITRLDVIHGDDAEGLRSTFSSPDPSKRPSLALISVPLVYYLTFVILLWRSWYSPRGGAGRGARSGTISGRHGHGCDRRESHPVAVVPHSEQSPPLTSSSGTCSSGTHTSRQERPDERKSSIGSGEGQSISNERLSVSLQNGGKPRMHQTHSSVHHQHVAVDVASAVRKSTDSYIFGDDTPFLETNRPSRSSRSVTIVNSMSFERESTRFFGMSTRWPEDAFRATDHQTTSVCEEKVFESFPREAKRNHGDATISRVSEGSSQPDSDHSREMKVSRSS